MSACTFQKLVILILNHTYPLSASMYDIIYMYMYTLYIVIQIVSIAFSYTIISFCFLWSWNENENTTTYFQVLVYENNPGMKVCVKICLSIGKHASLQELVTKISTGYFWILLWKCRYCGRFFQDIKQLFSVRILF